VVTLDHSNKPSRVAINIDSERRDYKPSKPTVDGLMIGVPLTEDDTLAPASSLSAADTWTRNARPYRQRG